MNAYMDMSDFISGIDLEQDGPTTTPAALQQLIDLGAVPALRPEAPSPWHPRLTFDIAMGEEPGVLLDRYHITATQLDTFYFIPSFRREVADHQKHIREEGVTFKQKARVQAEMYLEVLDDIVNDRQVSAATRLTAIQSVVKWGDLEPKVDKAAQAAGSMPQFNIQINL